MNSQTFLNWIDGRWVAGETVVENHSPSDTNDLIGCYTQATSAQVHAAISAAAAAQPGWAATGLEKRHDALRAIGDELIARSQELGRQLAREEGKTLAEGVGEVYRSGQFFHYFAAEVLRQLGGKADSVRAGIEIDIQREALGVVGVITPWNFPMATASWKIAPALAFGNAVLFKPANLTPASAWALTEIISRQALPSGTFNLLMGAGASVGNELAASQSVNGISFTGSVDTGRRIAAVAAPNLIKLQMEMGSKNALVVLDDADLDLAVECAFQGAYSGTGQKCTASSRLVVTHAVHRPFVERLTAKLRSVRVGRALDEGVQMGPVVDARQLEQNLRYIETGKREGARLVHGGEHLAQPERAYCMSPALFDEGRNDMQLNRDEVFGPIACVIPVRDYDEALAVSNDTPYGLTAGIVTQSLKYATHFRRHAQAGCVMVNLPTAGTDYHVPFGGRKSSSYGPREQGPNAAEFYTTLKTSYTRA
ncbi:Aldehyde dehydrogenase, thermostable [Paraburkholderia domus]|jgi:NAD-dependent aldehyde dehydrogenases|uniref:aldehyde dehydrogenase family protein n=1 Tax=Paraburkholderia domus TaxID=2793075 RepID=UPI001912CE6E|nr:aldehyde dehydrogenase family protein [Paraburkholderia domus]MBK5054023.1 aldehyde dehydrogenase family protein [Burkholderia sp. R-70006]CAE6850667.1 Aldehyde dehydrogenase, thermostable [Paraburkholderia domus]